MCENREIMISVYLTPDLKKRLKKIAKLEKRSISAMSAVLIEAKIREWEGKNGSV